MLSDTLRELEAQMADSERASDLNQVLQAYGRAQERFEALGGYTLRHEVETILNGLGFTPEQYELEVGVLRGGEKKLVNLARILLQMPDLLLLDEPDNHLDLDAKAWLEQYIQDYPGTVLIISHDRRLLDHTIKKIFELEDGKISAYFGDYSSYFMERQQRLLKQYELYNLQQDEIKRLEASMHQLKEWAKMNPKFAGRAERGLLFSYRDIYTAIRHLSGGEKSRLQLAQLMLIDANFLLLDEPTNNLDIASIEVLEVALVEFEGTILTVSHDRYFLDKIVSQIVAIGDDGRVEVYPGNFSYYSEKHRAA